MQRRNMPSFLMNLGERTATAAAYAFGAFLIGASLWGLFGPEPKPKREAPSAATPEMALYRAVQEVSSSAAFEFMLRTTTGHTPKEPIACTLASAFAAETKAPPEGQETAHLALLHQHEKACHIGRELRDATRPQLEAIARTGELLSLSFYFGLLNPAMQEGEWEKIGPFSDESLCEQFAAEALAAGFGVRHCERWLPAF